MNIDQNKRVFFHIGLGKTASTYLQYKVFPKIKGIYYIQRTKYRRAPRIIERSVHDNFFVSREFDRQMEQELDWFSQFCPHANVIIILRRHDQWITSQYRRYVKNGGAKSFSEFIDVDANKGKWNVDELMFYPKLGYIEKKFGKKPLVLFHDDLEKDPYGFIDKLVRFMDASYDKNKISIKAAHKSYSSKQLIFLRKFNRKVPIRYTKHINNKYKRWIRHRINWLIYHVLLYTASLIPAKFVNDKALISNDEMKKVKDFYAEDWDKCKQYAVNH